MKDKILYIVIFTILALSLIAIFTFFQYQEGYVDGHYFKVISLIPCMDERINFCTNPNEVQFTIMYVVKKE